LDSVLKVLVQRVYLMRSLLTVQHLQVAHNLTARDAS